MVPGQNTEGHEGRSKMTVSTKTNFTVLVVVDRKQNILTGRYARGHLIQPPHCVDFHDVAMFTHLALGLEATYLPITFILVHKQILMECPL